MPIGFTVIKEWHSSWNLAHSDDPVATVPPAKLRSLAQIALAESGMEGDLSTELTDDAEAALKSALERAAQSQRKSVRRAEIIQGVEQAVAQVVRELGDPAEAVGREVLATFKKNRVDSRAKGPDPVSVVVRDLSRRAIHRILFSVILADETLRRTLEQAAEEARYDPDVVAAWREISPAPVHHGLDVPPVLLSLADRDATLISRGWTTLPPLEDGRVVEERLGQWIDPRGHSFEVSEEDVSENEVGADEGSWVEGSDRPDREVDHVAPSLQAILDLAIADVRRAAYPGGLADREHRQVWWAGFLLLEAHWTVRQVDRASVRAHRELEHREPSSNALREVLIAAVSRATNPADTADEHNAGNRQLNDGKQLQENVYASFYDVVAIAADLLTRLPDGEVEPGPDGWPPPANSVLFQRSSDAFTRGVLPRDQIPTHRDKYRWGPVGSRISAEVSSNMEARGWADGVALRDLIRQRLHRELTAVLRRHEFRGTTFDRSAGLGGINNFWPSGGQESGLLQKKIAETCAAFYKRIEDVDDFTDDTADQAPSRRDQTFHRYNARGLSSQRPRSEIPRTPTILRQVDQGGWALEQQLDWVTVMVARLRWLLPLWWDELLPAHEAAGHNPLTHLPGGRDKAAKLRALEDFLVWCEQVTFYPENPRIGPDHIGAIDEKDTAFYSLVRLWLSTRSEDDKRTTRTAERNAKAITRLIRMIIRDELGPRGALEPGFYDIDLVLDFHTVTHKGSPSSVLDGI